MTQRETLKILKRGTIKTDPKFRVPCIGMCGAMVLRGSSGHLGGECRDCRRKRIRVGMKRIWKSGRR